MAGLITARQLDRSGYTGFATLGMISAKIFAEPTIDTFNGHDSS
jgi:hypothetical protein